MVTALFDQGSLINSICFVLMKSQCVCVCVPLSVVLVCMVMGHLLMLAVMWLVLVRLFDFLTES